MAFYRKILDIDSGLQKIGGRLRREADIGLAYLVTHPIQYQAPLLQRIAKEPDIRLKAFFASDWSIGNFRDPGFNATIRWDVPLLHGYDYEFLPAVSNIHHLSTLRPL